MKNTRFFAIAVITVLILTGCPDAPVQNDTNTGNNTPVTFTDLTANGSPTATTKKLTLTFDKDIADLSAADISLDAGTTGAVKGTLTRTDTGTYDLAVAGIGKTGPVAAFVSKSGYNITGGPKTVTVYFSGNTELSNNTTLISIQIADSAERAAMNANRSDVLGNIAYLAEVPLSAGKSNNAAITLRFAMTFNGTAKIAVVAASATVGEGDFTIEYNPGSKPLRNFADGDKLYVKMTAEDGVTVRYYGFQVIIGADATLYDIVFSHTYNIGFPSPVTEEINVDSLGEALNTLSDFNADNQGQIQFKVLQPATGFKIQAVSNDPDATVTMSMNGSGWNINNDANVIFNEGDYLYVKVVSGNQQVTRYYKIGIYLKGPVQIPYGTPATINAASPDAKWNGASEWLPINRPGIDGADWLELPDADKSFGQAKLMWDENGLWVYAQVWEKNVSLVGADADGSGEHMVSSVELFINEAYSAGVTTGNVTQSNNNGGQYRMGANGERSGSPTAAVTAFNTLGKYSAQKYTGNMPAAPDSIKLNDINNGYAVIFQAPWRFTSQYPLADNKKISIELQINVTGSDGSRIGVLNWNNISSGSYMSLADYGEAVLLPKP